MEPRRVADILQERGVRATQQRMAVYDYLLLHPIHPTADMIFTALTPRYPSFSRTTIYNTLHTLVDAGLIREVNIDPQEQRFDGNPSDHGHFRCRHCGEIFDFDLQNAVSYTHLDVYKRQRLPCRSFPVQNPMKTATLRLLKL